MFADEEQKRVRFVPTPSLFRLVFIAFEPIAWNREWNDMGEKIICEMVRPFL